MRPAHDLSSDIRCLEENVHGTSIPIKELQAKCSRIMQLVELGEHFTVTVHKRPVAQITPVSRRRTVPFHVALDLAAHHEPIPRGEPRTPEMKRPRALIDQSLLNPDDPNPVLPLLVDLHETELSAVTLGEVTWRALRADDSSRWRHIATLSAVESCWDPLPVDTVVAREFGRLLASSGSVRRSLSDQRVLVAATALAHDLSLVTRSNEYDVLEPLGLRVQRV
jgi:predicted nucleic acid-binding protein